MYIVEGDNLIDFHDSNLVRIVCINKLDFYLHLFEVKIANISNFVMLTNKNDQFSRNKPASQMPENVWLASRFIFG